MKYSNGKEIKSEDIIYWTGPYPIEKGIVMCLVDKDLSLDGYDFTMLRGKGGGVMIFSDGMGLIQIARDDEPDIDLIERMI